MSESSEGPSAAQLEALERFLVRHNERMLDSRHALVLALETEVASLTPETSTEDR